MVSVSRISPTRITSGSCRKAFLSAPATLCASEPTSPVRMNKFDRVLNTDDVHGTPLGYRLSHARHRCALAFTARASHQYQAGSLVTPFVQYRRMSQGF